jgi:hypothetical protein
MLVLVWLVFFGLAIEIGAILTSYTVSCFNPVAAKNLYLGLNLSAFYQLSFWHYTLYVAFMVGFLCTKAFVAWLVTKAMSRVNLQNPFTPEVARILESIGYILLAVSLISVVNNFHTSWLFKQTGSLRPDWDTGEFLFMAGLVFIISQVFKRGVEIQSEHDLTV